MKWRYFDNLIPRSNRSIIRPAAIISSSGTPGFPDNLSYCLAKSCIRLKSGRISLIETAKEADCPVPAFKACWLISIISASPLAEHRNNRIGKLLIGTGAVLLGQQRFLALVRSWHSSISKVRWQRFSENLIDKPRACAKKKDRTCVFEVFFHCMNLGNHAAPHRHIMKMARNSL